MIESLRNWFASLYRNEDSEIFDEVLAAEVYSAFEDVTNLLNSGFRVFSPGKYVRNVDENIGHVIKLQRVKGASYSLLWGCSLSFVPHFSGSRLSWHSSPRSARLDLFREPANFIRPRLWQLESDNDYLADCSSGSVNLHRTLTRMWSGLEPAVFAWFEGIASLDGLLREAEFRAGMKWLAYTHDPDPRLIRVFTLKQLGRMHDATEYFDEFASSNVCSAGQVEKLRGALHVT